MARWGIYSFDMNKYKNWDVTKLKAAHDYIKECYDKTNLALKDFPSQRRNVLIAIKDNERQIEELEESIGTGESHLVVIHRIDRPTEDEPDLFYAIESNILKPATENFKISSEKEMTPENFKQSSIEFLKNLNSGLNSEYSHMLDIANNLVEKRIFLYYEYLKIKEIIEIKLFGEKVEDKIKNPEDMLRSIFLRRDEIERETTLTQAILDYADVQKFVEHETLARTDIDRLIKHLKKTFPDSDIKRGTVQRLLSRHNYSKPQPSTEPEQ